MHQPHVAGKFIAVECDDAARKVLVGAKVLDDADWKKCEEGAYSGFSIGGKYLKRWSDPDQPGVTRYTAAPAEGSLVDNPCMYGATFSVVKADGATELRKFQTPATPDEDAAAKADATADAAADAVADADELGKAGARNSRADLAHLQGIHDSAVAMGAACSGSTSKTASAAQQEDNPMDEQTLRKVLGESVQGLSASLQESLEKKVGDTLAKAVDEAVTKAVGAATEPITKGLEAATAAVTELKTANEDLGKRLKDLEDKPEPGKGIVRPAAAKGAEGGDERTPEAKPLAKLTPAETEKLSAVELMKLALRPSEAVVITRPQPAAQ